LAVVFVQENAFNNFVRY